MYSISTKCERFPEENLAYILITFTILTILGIATASESPARCSFKFSILLSHCLVSEYYKRVDSRISISVGFVIFGDDRCAVIFKQLALLRLDLKTSISSSLCQFEIVQKPIHRIENAWIESTLIVVESTEDDSKVVCYFIICQQTEPYLAKSNKHIAERTDSVK